MIDFVALRKQKPGVVGERNTLPTDIQIGDTYVARDKRQREGRTVPVLPAVVTAITGPITGNAPVRVTLRHPTCTTYVRLDRFREHYVKVTGNSNNGSN